MKSRYKIVIFTTIVIFIVFGLLYIGGGPRVKHALVDRNHNSIVASEISAIANLLSLRPQTAMDFSKVSGEYCFQINLEQGGHMTHYAIDPLNTQEDVIDFVNADPLLKAGVVLDNIPKFPGKLGSMTPNQWYFLPKGEFEPHHGSRFPFPLLIKAVNVK